MLVALFAIFKDGYERHHYFVGECFVKVSGVNLSEATEITFCDTTFKQGTTHEYSGLRNFNAPFVEVG